MHQLSAIVRKEPDLDSGKTSKMQSSLKFEPHKFEFLVLESEGTRAHLLTSLGYKGTYFDLMQIWNQFPFFLDQPPETPGFKEQTIPENKFLSLPGLGQQAVRREFECDTSYYLEASWDRAMSENQVFPDSGEQVYGFKYIYFCDKAIVLAVSRNDANPLVISEAGTYVKWETPKRLSSKEMPQDDPYGIYRYSRYSGSSLSGLQIDMIEAAKQKNLYSFGETLEMFSSLPNNSLLLSVKANQLNWASNLEGVIIDLGDGKLRIKREGLEELHEIYEFQNYPARWSSHPESSGFIIQEGSQLLLNGSHVIYQNDRLVRTRHSRDIFGARWKSCPGGILVLDFNTISFVSLQGETSIVASSSSRDGLIKDINYHSEAGLVGSRDFETIFNGISISDTQDFIVCPFKNGLLANESYGKFVAYNLLNGTKKEIDFTNKGRWAMAYRDGLIVEHDLADGSKNLTFTRPF